MSMDRCYNLAEQVLFDILLFLPVMSLLRFKAVCKDWFSLIESSTFVSEHLNHQRDSKEDNLIFRIYGEGIVLHSGSQYEECVYDIDIGQFWDFWHPADEVDLIGYCDGIIFLAHSLIAPHFYEIALWNPALKQLRPLPPPLFHDRIFLSEEHCSVHASFGIDVKRNDYKLVRILLLYSDTYDMIGNQVEVYNLGGDNSWRITHKDDVLPFHCLSTFAAISSSKYGKCFWMAELYNYVPILLSFDFNDEAFRTMQLPLGNQNGVSGVHYKLDLVDEKVVCILGIPSDEDDEDDKNIEIWMLHEFGAEESWNKIYKIGPLSFFDLFDPLLISRNGEFLIGNKFDITVQEGQYTEGEKTFYLYNLHTQQGKFHQNCNINLNHSFPIHYSASLLSLKSVNNVRPAG